MMKRSMIRRPNAAESLGQRFVFFIADDGNTGVKFSTITKIDSDYQGSFEIPTVGQCYKISAFTRVGYPRPNVR
jgi:hypothetical protein